MRKMNINIKLMILNLILVWFFIIIFTNSLFYLMNIRGFKK